MGGGVNDGVSAGRRKCKGEFMDGRSRLYVTQSESDLPDCNQSEH